MRVGRMRIGKAPLAIMALFVIGVIGALAVQGAGAGGNLFGTVNFTKLNVTKRGSGGGSVTSDVGGIDCGLTCSALVVSGGQIRYTATPDADSKFVRWNGVCDGNTNTVCTALTYSSSVTATFEALPSTYPLTVTLANMSGAQIKGAPNQSTNYLIACGSIGTTCSAQVPHGQQLSMSVFANEGYLFRGWTGACTGGSCLLTMDGPKALTADVVPGPPTVLNISVSDMQHGHVGTTLDTNLQCGTRAASPGLEQSALLTKCSTTYPQNTHVHLTPTLFPGYTMRWEGCEEVIPTGCSMRLKPGMNVTLWVTKQ